MTPRRFGGTDSLALTRGRPPSADRVCAVNDELATPTHQTPAGRTATGFVRLLWVAAGLVCVGIGGLGIIVPGLPTTVFFIAAAACFARSHPRLEQWVLDLPRVGPMVRDYRAGLGMPRRAKTFAVGSIVVFTSIAVVVIDPTWLRIGIAVFGATGVAYVLLRVKTRDVDATRVSTAEPHH